MRRPQARRSRPAATGSKLQLGQKFKGQVRDVSADGNGVVAHESGQVFFVPGVWFDELVEVRVSGFKGRFGHAELHQLVQASPHRIEAPCPYQGFTKKDCGGCPWQFVSYEAQLAAKQARVETTLASVAAPEAIKPIWPSPRSLGYRNRTQLKTDGRRLGYLAANSHELVDVDDCLILTDVNRQTLAELRSQLPCSAWRQASSHKLTTLDIDESVTATSASVNARLPFKQANTAQNDRMRAWLGERLAPLEKARSVLELFAGAGNFTEIIAGAGFASTVAVEGDEGALATLAAQLPEVVTQPSDLFADTAAEMLRRVGKGCDVLVLDPPRDGLKNERLRSAQGIFDKKSKLRDVFYISCNLATLKRDIKSFVDHGYQVLEVQPLDQFPHTPHVELMVHLTRC